jgi:hypothetical protein
MKLSTIINLDVPEWERSSDPAEDGRLYATIEILGALHHLEAVPVTEHERHGQVGQTDLADDLLGEYGTAFGAEGGPFMTVEIEGQQYAVFMSPYCL